jgi:hypothetical protein
MYSVARNSLETVAGDYNSRLRNFKATHLEIFSLLRAVRLEE